MTDDIYRPLPREEVIKAVERRRPARVPLVRAQWWGEGLFEQYGQRLAHFDRYPEDAVVALYGPLDIDRMRLSWREGSHNRANRAHDSGGVIPDWSCLDEFIAKMPNPDTDDAANTLRAGVEHAKRENRYLLCGWWNLFFERPWTLRGMENLLADYYESPREIHRLHEALCDLYCRAIARLAREYKPDGFWTSDDLGHQTQCMMSPATFREFLKPYYARVGEACRKAGMHFWLHSCGNNTDILGDLIEAGVHVFHPVQKHTMDEQAVAKKYGGRLTFLAGFDVQHILQEGTPDQVRQEVRYLIDTFDREDGGMCLAAGNGIVAGTPFENIEAFLDQAVRYGAQHRRGVSILPAAC